MNRFVPGYGQSFALVQLVCILFDAIAELNDPRVNEAINRRMGVPLIWGNEQIWPRPTTPLQPDKEVPDGRAQGLRDLEMSRLLPANRLPDEPRDGQEGPGGRLDGNGKRPGVHPE